MRLHLERDRREISGVTQCWKALLIVSCTFDPFDIRVNSSIGFEFNQFLTVRKNCAKHRISSGTKALFTRTDAQPDIYTDEKWVARWPMRVFRCRNFGAILVVWTSPYTAVEPIFCPCKYRAEYRYVWTRLKVLFTCNVTVRVPVKVYILHPEGTSKDFWLKRGKQ